MRRFEMNDGGASKFWEVDVDGSAVVVRFGRIGAAGQRKEKTLATAEAARAEAEKLVREKLGKGYVEIGGGAAERPTKASAKAPTTATTPALARPTGRFGWTEEIDALFARGFPYLRELTDAVVSPKEAAREAKKGCQAIDPYFPVRLPRDVAARYLRGYAFHPFEEVEAQARAIDADRAIDGAYLREILATKFAPAPDKRRETYVFRIQEVLFLFEAFLGTEEVVAAAVEHLVRARVHPDAWTPDGSAFFVDHSNSNAARLVAPLGWLRLRLDPARWQALVAPLRGSNARLPEFSARLAALVDDAAPARQDEIAIAMQRRDAAPLRRSLERRPYFEEPQLYYVVGAEELLRVKVAKLPQLPKWHQLRIIDEFGAVRAPGAARVIAALLPSRSAGAAAAARLDARRAFVDEEVLPALDAGDPATSAAIRAHFGGAAPAPKRTKKQLEAELRDVLASVGPALVAAGRDEAKERAVLAGAFARYCEIRAALEEVIPEAYFTHMLGEHVPAWKVDRETSMRWMELAVDVAV